MPAAKFSLMLEPGKSINILCLEAIQTERNSTQQLASSAKTRLLMFPRLSIKNQCKSTDLSTAQKMVTRMETEAVVIDSVVDRNLCIVYMD
jgi:hypothetical protein